MGSSEVGLGALNVGVPLREEALGGHVVARARVAGEESGGGMWVSAVVKAERGVASGLVDAIILGELGGGEPGVPGVLTVVAVGP